MISSHHQKALGSDANFDDNTGKLKHTHINITYQEALMNSGLLHISKHQ